MFESDFDFPSWYRRAQRIGPTYDMYPHLDGTQSHLPDNTKPGFLEFTPANGSITVEAEATGMPHRIRCTKSVAEGNGGYGLSALPFSVAGQVAATSLRIENLRMSSPPDTPQFIIRAGVSGTSPKVLLEDTRTSGGCRFGWHNNGSWAYQDVTNVPLWFGTNADQFKTWTIWVFPHARKAGGVRGFCGVEHSDAGDILIGSYGEDNSAASLDTITAFEWLINLGNSSPADSWFEFTRLTLSRWR